jgi:hypothetical protein
MRTWGQQIISPVLKVPRQCPPVLLVEVLHMKLKLIYDRQSVGQSVLVSGAHLGPATNFTLSSKFSSDSCVFVTL